MMVQGDRIDTRLIYKILQSLTGLNGLPIYNDLLLEENAGNSFAGNRGKKSWWPSHDSFFYNAYKLNVEGKGLDANLNPDDQRFPLDGDWAEYHKTAEKINKKFQTPQNDKEFQKLRFKAEEIPDQLTFESRVYDVLLKYCNLRPAAGELSAKETILRACEYIHQDYLKEIRRISNEGSVEDLLDYIIKQAKASKGIPYREEYVAPLEQQHEGDVEFRTYFDLLQIGLNAKSIAKNLLENDRKILGDIGLHAGDTETWASHISSLPENWGFLCTGKKIVGNWSCTFLTQQQEQLMTTGKIIGNEFTAESAAEALANNTGEVQIHILNMSINDGYQTEENWSVLWKSFAERLHILAQKGLYYRNISAILFPKGNANIVGMFEGMGFKEKAKCSKGGKIYLLDLTFGFPKAFRRIMPTVSLNDHYEERVGKIEFVQLSRDDGKKLTPQQHEDIAMLCYATDRYIYSSMFTSPYQAKALLPMVFATQKDAMFNFEHCYVAKAGSRIIGLILHKKGELNWSSECLRDCALLMGEKLPETLDAVEKEYFTRYNVKSTRSVINFCVNTNWLSKDIQVGIDFMESFVKTFGTDTLRVYVLKEALHEMMIYLNNNFALHSLCDGWSADSKKPPCAIMLRPADKK